MKSKRRSKRSRKQKLAKAYKKQIIQEVIRLSRKEISSECLVVPPIKPTHKLFLNGEYCDAKIGRGLWLNHYNYQEGYIGVAIRLLDFIRLSDNIAIKDSYIFVSLFCFRQYLELSMKDSLIHFYKGDALTIVHECGHDLLSLYEKILKLPNMEQDEETNVVMQMLNTIQGYDPTGTVFRYPYSINNQTGEIKASLKPNIGLKDVRMLKTRMMQLYNFFDGINSMVHDYERNGIRYAKQ